jgi:ribosomal RNA-processing protein 9
VSESCKYLFTSGKEGSIIKWDLVTGKKLVVFHKLRPSKQREGKGKQKMWSGDINGHTDEVLALALSGDGKYLASGGKDRKVGVWDVQKDEWVKGFRGHKDTVSVSDKEVLIKSISLIVVGRKGSCISQRNSATLQRLLRPYTAFT